MNKAAQAKLLKGVRAAIRNDKELADMLEAHQANPQIKEMVIKAKARKEAFDAVLDVLESGDFTMLNIRSYRKEG